MESLGGALKLGGTMLIIVVFACAYLCRIYFSSIRKRTCPGKSEIVIGFFHPHCFGGGGGERVLWKAVKALGELRDAGIKIKVVIYTIDDKRDSYKKDIFHHIKERFATEFSQSLPIIFVHIGNGPKLPKKMSLIAQSVETIKLAWYALRQLNPHIYIDTTGCAFTFLVAKLAGCKIMCYVHYPTISTDMLRLVWERRPSYNNSSIISRNPLTSYLKLVYYIIFAIAYGFIGSLSDLVMVNSSWTHGHIYFLWVFARRRTHIVYPPCDTKSLQNLSLTNREHKILSIGQFRPEKNHTLQVKAFAKMMKDHPELSKKGDVELFLVGGCRDEGDESRVNELKRLASSLGVSKSVHFVLNQPYPVLKQIFGQASVGIHTMWNEHFGIGVVEMMAAGLITIAHNSGGPKSDILLPYGKDKLKTGYLASSEEEYADAMYNALHDGPNCEENIAIRKRARKSAQRFSDEVFNTSFKEVMLPNL